LRREIAGVADLPARAVLVFRTNAGEENEFALAHIGDGHRFREDARRPGRIVVRFLLHGLLGRG
jgi:hypothetical protein